MKVKVILDHSLAKQPFRANEDDTGYDLTAVAIHKETEDYIMYNTGLKVAPAEVVDLQLRARSSIYKTGLVLANSVGTIDSGYRGDLMFCFYKVGKNLSPYKIGDRIGQIVCSHFEEIEWEYVMDLDSSDRGDGGFGSSNK